MATQVHCPTCGVILEVLEVDRVPLRWSSIECKRCHSIVIVHIAMEHIYVKAEAPSHQLMKNNSSEWKQLEEELEVI
jgi:hypothetical protein